MIHTLLILLFAAPATTAAPDDGFVVLEDFESGDLGVLIPQEGVPRVVSPGLNGTDHALSNTDSEGDNAFVLGSIDFARLKKLDPDEPLIEISVRFDHEGGEGYNRLRVSGETIILDEGFALTKDVDSDLRGLNSGETVTGTIDLSFALEKLNDPRATRARIRIIANKSEDLTGTYTIDEIRYKKAQ